MLLLRFYLNAQLCGLLFFIVQYSICILPLGRDDSFRRRSEVRGRWSKERMFDLSRDCGRNYHQGTARPLWRLESRFLRLLVRSQLERSFPGRVVPKERTPASTRWTGTSMMWSSFFIRLSRWSSTAVRASQDLLPSLNVYFSLLTTSLVFRSVHHSFVQAERLCLQW